MLGRHLLLLLLLDRGVPLLAWQRRAMLARLLLLGREGEGMGMEGVEGMGEAEAREREVGEVGEGMERSREARGGA